MQRVRERAQFRPSPFFRVPPNLPLTIGSHLCYTYFCRNRQVYPERFSRRVPLRMLPLVALKEVTPGPAEETPAWDRKWTEKPQRRLKCRLNSLVSHTFAKTRPKTLLNHILTKKGGGWPSQQPLGFKSRLLREGKRGQINIAAAKDDSDSRNVAGLLGRQPQRGQSTATQQRRHRHGRRRLDEDFHPLPDHFHRRDDFLLADQ